MNGHERRRQQISERIKKTALELFTNQGVNRVSMDEIAAQAKVSKVTIYKYFHSKEELQLAVVDLYVDEVFTATNKILESNLSFIEKLKITLMAKDTLPNVADSRALYDLLEKGGRNSGDGQTKPGERVRELMYRFYEQGKKEGYIEEDLPFELIYLYQQIVEAGFEAKLDELQPVLTDPKAFDQLLNLFYFGIIRKRE